MMIRAVPKGINTADKAEESPNRGVAEGRDAHAELSSSAEAVNVQFRGRGRGFGTLHPTAA
jgi:hypothetical protein